MRFGLVPVGEAEGAILAHSVAAGGTTLKKGRQLSAQDLAAIAAAGIGQVMIARLEPGDVPEDAAAERVARAIGGPAVRIAEAFTGRVNLFAEAAGILTLDRTALIALNGLDEGLTVATLEPYARVAAGQMVATVKIIPFSLAEDLIARAEALARSERLRLAVAPFMAKRAGLVLTRLPQSKPNVLKKREKAMRVRLAALGATLERVETVPHEAGEIGRAIAGQSAEGLDPILVFGASAIVDRGDVVPAGLVAAGGEVAHLGLPVDPGNLLMLGRLEGQGAVRSVIGVPSCASSVKENGFDWVLERVCAGLEVDRAAIVAMAPGGLLMEIESRPQPRSGRATNAERAHPRIAALVLAAGRSTRMAPRNKLLEEVAGVPVVRRAVEAVIASQARPVVVVTGHEVDRVRAALAGLEVRFIHNEAFADGLSTSLAKGIASLPPDSEGALVVLGDMPVVEAGHLDRLIAAFAPEDGRAICVPVAAGRRGNPVLWAARYFSAMLDVEGDTGARHLIGAHADMVAEVEVDGEAVLSDVDTAAALAEVRAHWAARQGRD